SLGHMTSGRNSTLANPGPSCKILASRFLPVSIGSCEAIGLADKSDGTSLHLQGVAVEPEGGAIGVAVVRVVNCAFPLTIAGRFHALEERYTDDRPGTERHHRVLGVDLRLTGAAVDGLLH